MGNVTLRVNKAGHVRYDALMNKQQLPLTCRTKTGYISGFSVQITTGEFVIIYTFLTK